MNEKEAERAAREYMAGVTVSLIELQFMQLVEHTACMTPEHAQRILAAVERYSAARKLVIAPARLLPGTDARN